MNSGQAKSWSESELDPELEVEEIPAPTLSDAMILFDYYASVLKSGDMPSRFDIDPLAIPRDVLKSVYLLEPVENYTDWTYRLIGADIVERFQVDRTGQSLRSFLPELRAKKLIRSSNRSVTERRPIFYRLLPHHTTMEDFYAETMSLPVQDERSGKIWLFGGTFFGGVDT